MAIGNPKEKLPKERSGNPQFEKGNNYKGRPNLNAVKNEPLTNAEAKRSLD